MPKRDQRQASGLARAKREIATLEKALKEGFAPYGIRGSSEYKSALTVAAQRVGANRISFRDRVGTPDQDGSHWRLFQLRPDWSLYQAKVEEVVVEEPEVGPFVGFEAPHPPPVATTDSPKWELVSDKNNKFVFGAMGDLHAASKYCRWEVREDMMRRAIDAGAQCILDTGNWIDGEAPFNRYDLEVVGLEAQISLLAERYPRLPIKTFAVTGDDHEGWYVRREGVNVGRYCESVMRSAGYEWTDLGYMEADIVLRNANSGATSILRVCHPGGGSSYAVSYRPQKIIESYEGGEKPSAVLFGHYHKLDAGNTRNVWWAQTGCGQDQTPFMRKKSLEAHVGGLIIEIEQDPVSGALIGFKVDMRRYFNKAYYTASGLANNRWSGHGKVSMVPRKLGSMQ